MAWIAHQRAQTEADSAWAEVLRKQAIRLAEKQRNLKQQSRKKRRKQKPPKLGWFNPDGTVNHRLYIHSPDWAERKRQYFSRHRRKCARCPSTERIQLHHKTYENLGMEKDEDLEPLCEDCHNMHHGYR